MMVIDEKINPFPVKEAKVPASAAEAGSNPGRRDQYATRPSGPNRSALVADRSERAL